LLKQGVLGKKVRVGTNTGRNRSQTSVAASMGLWRGRPERTGRSV
jgi:hypothetical protein